MLDKRVLKMLPKPFGLSAYKVYVIVDESAQIYRATFVSTEVRCSSSLVTKNNSADAEDIFDTSLELTFEDISEL